MLTRAEIAQQSTTAEHDFVLELAREYVNSGRPVTYNAVGIWLAMDKGLDPVTVRKLTSKVAGHAMPMVPGKDGEPQPLGQALSSAVLHGFIDDEGSGP